MIAWERGHLARRRNGTIVARTAGGTPALPGATNVAASGYELRILPDPNIYDGRYANNAWLQELPKPQTKICWENVVLISPKTAVALGYDDKRRDALVNEKQTLAVLDHTERSSMEIHGIALQVIFKSRYHGKKKGAKYLLQKLGLTIY